MARITISEIYRLSGRSGLSYYLHPALLAEGCSAVTWPAWTTQSRICMKSAEHGGYHCDSGRLYMWQIPGG